MRKSLAFLALLALVFFSCSKTPQKQVLTEPQNPVWGENFRVTYTPNKSYIPLKVFLVARFYFDNYDSIFVKEMDKKGSAFITEISIPKSSNLLQIKFTDERGKDDLKDGMGWLFLVRKTPLEVSPGALRTLGEVSEIGIGWVEGDKEKALEIYKKASKQHPQDPLLMADILNLKLSLGKNVADSAHTVADLFSKRDDANSLYAAIDLYKALEDTEKVRETSERFLSLFKDDKRAPEVDLSLSFLKKPQSANEWERIVEAFYHRHPNYKKRSSLLGSLGSVYYRNGDLTDALAALRWADTLSDYDLSYKLGIARILLDNGFNSAAEVLLDSLKGKITEEMVIRSFPWSSEKRRDEEFNYWNLEYFDAYSILYTNKKKPDSALFYLMKMVDYASRDQKPGILSQAIQTAESQGDTTVLLNALWKLFLLRPNDATLKNRIRGIYVAQGNSEKDFEKTLQEKLGNIKYKKAPDFEVTDLEGKKLKLSDFKGKVVVINFWATWCNPCKGEIPHLNEVAKKFKGSNVEFLGISHEGKNVVNKFLSKSEFDYHICINGGKVFNKYGVTGIPTHVLIDAKGRIRYKHIGFTPNIGDRLKEEIETLLSEVS